MSRLTLLVGIVLAVCAFPAFGLPGAGEEAPGFVARDINGKTVDLDQLVQEKPDMVILFLFTTETGGPAALKLRRLDMLYGQKLQIVAVGLKEAEGALKDFAEGLGIEYYVVKDTPEAGVAEKYGPVPQMPTTIILTGRKRVHQIIKGSGQTEAELINAVAISYFQQRKLEEAQRVADEALAAGESAEAARETKGFAFVAEGKLEAAQAEFGKIDSKEGLAKVALEKGDYQKAIEIAGEADGAYAGAVKGEALARTGKLDEAAAALESASQKPARDWQKSEALDTFGRVKQEQGEPDAAIELFEQAIALDPYNVVALSNEGAAHRRKGDLKKAAETLERARAIRDDEFVALMLRQVQKEMAEENDVKRGELIRAQIEDLRKRYEALKAEGNAHDGDDWTSPPLVVAFLPPAGGQSVFFDRAGMDVVLRREIEARLQASDAVRVVEREVLDKLLQELQLGSSQLASADTQLQLGKVLSARMLGFIDFAQVGGDILMYLRLVDTETTSLAAQLTRTVDDPAEIPALAGDLAAEVVAKLANGRRLQGLIAEAGDDEGIIINLGARHGVKKGQQFHAVTDGPPIEAGGKVIGHREVKAALLEVTQVEDQYSIARILARNGGAGLAKNMKVKQAKAQ